jgi:hypothetical protein
MSAGWVAGSVRARALARRRLGADRARQVASCGSLPAALGALAATGYPGIGEQSQDLAAAQHAIAAAVLWNLRVLAGWLPRGGLRVMRPLAAWFEIANIDELLEELAGHRAGERFELGGLATAWPQLRGAASLAELRTGLAASAWKDPGGDSALAVRVGIRARWAERVAALGGPAPLWAASAVALLLAGERFTAGHRPNPVLDVTARNLLGTAAAGAVTFAELRDRLPAQLAWLLASAQGTDDLWRAEAVWQARVEQDALGLLRSATSDWRPVLGAAAALAMDARRAGAALELAARGGKPLEAYDALA